MLNFLNRIQFADLQSRSKQFIYWGIIAVLTGFYWLPNYKIQAYVFHVTVLIPFLVFHWRKLLMPWYSNVHMIAITFILYSGLSSFWTIGEPIRPLFRGVVYIAFLWVYAVAINWLFYEGSKGKKFNLFMQIMCFGGAAIGMLSVFVFYSRHPISERLEPFFSNENLIIFAQCLGLSGIMGLLLYNTNKKYFWLLCAVICFLMMLLSQTRGVLVGTALSLICFFIFSDSKGKGAMSVIALLIVFIIAKFNIFQRMFNVESERWQIYSRIIENIRGHEIFGMGLMNNTNLATGGFGYPHSMFLTTYYTGGAVGSVLLISLIAISLWEAFSFARSGGEITGLVLAVYGIGIYLFDGGHLVSHLHGEWLFFWLPIMLIASQKFHKDHSVLSSFE
ncbi:MAG: O-antigen ligase family protein [Gammaproteobacteria bacterium]